MATASIADKLAKLETKIVKREKTIADETKELEKDKAEYNRLYIMLLSDKYKLSGKDLFSATGLSFTSVKRSKKLLMSLLPLVKRIRNVSGYF